MFGIRPDGRAVGKHMDPITRITPFIMPHRYDAQVFTTQYFDADAINAYCQKKRREGIKMNHMSVIIAAYLRTCAQMPMLNRFVVNKKIYTRNEMVISFMTVRFEDREKFSEGCTKLYLHPRMTAQEVSDILNRAVDYNRQLGNDTATEKIANLILGLPFVASLAVGILKLLDRFGLLPRPVLHASPFHTSLFISNMGSIKMNDIFHHIYEFGTTSIFLGVGRRTVRVRLAADGTLKAKHYYPVGCVIDERIMPGAQYGMAFDLFSKFIRNPELLDEPPAEVKYDAGLSYEPDLSKNPG